MKLLIENWRNYIAEIENSKDYGTLYLFEEGEVRQTSFYGRFISLNESEDELDLFFEQWEKSANYELDRLDEINFKALKENPALYLSTQAYVLIGRAKDKIFKYIGKIKAVLSRASRFLKRFEESNPKLYKTGSMAIKVAIAMTGYVALQAILGSMGVDMDTAQAGNLDFFGSEIRNLDQTPVFSEDQLRSVGELFSTWDDPEMQKFGQNLVDAANSPDNTEILELADASRRDIESVIQDGIDYLSKADASAAEAAEAASEAIESASDVATDPSTAEYTQGNSNLQAINYIQKIVMYADTKPDVATAGLEKLVDLQNSALSPESLKGVDLSSLSRDEFLQLSKKIKSELAK